MVMSMFASCATWNKISNTAKGAGIGAVAGGAAGAVIGKVAGNTAVGAVIGAAVGGTAGALIGRRMDKQQKEMQNDFKGATITRVGEGIIITFASGILFDYNKSSLQPASKANLDQLVATLKKYDDTNLLIVGHTDDKGADDYNKTLSEKRAQSVTNYVSQHGITTSRVTLEGKGEVEPLGDNTTDAGRAQNRRVEVAIFANKKMQRMAKRGELVVD